MNACPSPVRPAPTGWVQGMGWAGRMESPTQDTRSCVACVPTLAQSAPLTALPAFILLSSALQPLLSGLRPLEHAALLPTSTPSLASHCSPLPHHQFLLSPCSSAALTVGCMLESRGDILIQWVWAGPGQQQLLKACQGGGRADPTMPT